MAGHAGVIFSHAMKQHDRKLLPVKDAYYSVVGARSTCTVVRPVCQRRVVGKAARSGAYGPRPRAAGSCPAAIGAQVRCLPIFHALHRLSGRSRANRLLFGQRLGPGLRQKE
jgi:hypothetical protein